MGPADFHSSEIRQQRSYGEQCFRSSDSIRTLDFLLINKSKRRSWGYCDGPGTGSVRRRSVRW
jgi:hypothetical protein